MFLRHEQSDSTKKTPEQLEKERQQIQRELDRALESLGLSREQLDTYLKDPSSFSSTDALIFERELRDFRYTLDMACFGQGVDQIKQRREEMRQRGQWIDSK